jgi:hypothetical protein
LVLLDKRFKNMTAEEFNEKYGDFLEEGHYGLALDDAEAVEYLDSEFQELVKIPGFSYSQIKGKFSWFCFYCTNVPTEKRNEIEQALAKIYSTQ